MKRGYGRPRRAGSGANDTIRGVGMPPVDEGRVAFLRRVESGKEERRPLRNEPPQDAGPSEEVPQAAREHPRPVSVVAKHRPDRAEVVAEEVQGRVLERAPQPLRAAPGHRVDVERDRLVLGLLDGVPPPELRDPRVGPREGSGPFVEEGGGEDRGDVLQGDGGGKAGEGGEVLLAPPDALQERPLQLVEVVAAPPAEGLVVGGVDAAVHRLLADEAAHRLAQGGVPDPFLVLADRVDEEAFAAREGERHRVEECGPERAPAVPVAGERLLEVEGRMPGPDGAAAGHPGGG